MNRSALCIRMLMYLASHSRVKIDELADFLDTKPRNIRAFKEELETAGYQIEHKTGRYGGYSLKESTFLPSLALSVEERKALEQAERFLKAHPEFAYGKEYTNAFIKIANQDRIDSQQNSFYKSDHRLPLSLFQQMHVKIIEEAIEQKKLVEIVYQGRKDSFPKTRTIEPYALINQREKNYVLAYDREKDDYRYFRFSDKRWLSCALLATHFLARDDVPYHKEVGEEQEALVTLAINRDSIRFFLEEYWGEEMQIVQETPSQLFYSFKTPSTRQLLNRIFAMRGNVHLVAPKELVDSFHAQLKELLCYNDKNDQIK